jgi:hypothetical protein
VYGSSPSDIGSVAAVSSAFGVRFSAYTEMVASTVGWGMSGSVPRCAYLCEIRRIGPGGG